jgi:type III secretion system YscD/HrpQ family protein
MPKHLIVTDGPMKGLVFLLEDQDEYIIGRDPDQSNFAVEDSTVSRKHAKLKKEDDGYSIEDLSTTNPILVNDQNISFPHLLKEGDVVMIGKTPFTYSEKELSEDFISPSSTSATQNEFETIFSDENFEQENIEEEPFEEAKAEIPKTDEKREDNFENESFEEKKEEENFQAIVNEKKKEEENLEEKKEDNFETIFEEDTEGAPYKLTPENALILKVLSGPNAGAEFYMEKEREYRIGKDPDFSNIVFNDMSVSKDHAKISIDKEGNVFIEDLSSKNGVIVNSKKIKELQKISSKDLVLVGTTTFIVLDPKEALETIYSPQPLIEEEKKIEEKEAVKEKRSIIWRKQIIPLKHLTIAGSIFIVLFVMFLTFFSLFRSNKVEVAQKNPVEEIKGALAKFSGVEFSYNPASEKLFLVGHVLTSIDEQEMTYNLSNLDIVSSVENNVIIDELVWKPINDLLNNNPNWRNVSIHSFKAGKFVANGYLQSNEEAQKLIGYLNANFPYVDKLENRVVIENILKLQIEGAIITKGLGAVSYQLNNGELVLAGRYSYENEADFEKLLDELKKMDGVRVVKNLSIKTTPDMARIDLTQSYKVTGYVSSADKGISIVVNNKILNVNGQLDGMKVTEINPDSIYLEKDGLKYKIDYKR